MICKHCGHTVPQDSGFCQYCGAALAPARQAVEKSEVEKGYAYLELKEWKQAKASFDASIVNGQDKAQAFIGRLLARLHYARLEALVPRSHDLQKYEDFCMALQYADTVYKAQLERCAEENAAQRRQKRCRQQKRWRVTGIVASAVVVLSALSYFVLIPGGRYLYYKHALSGGEAQQAAKAYQGSRWFEYHGRVKQLFYTAGVSFVKEKQYAQAENCFASVKAYKDAEDYYHYCKGQVLLAEDDLESYNYFIKCRNFLDTNSIITTNVYLSQLHRLQGTWHHPTIKQWESEAEWRQHMRKSGYLEINGNFYDPDVYDPDYKTEGSLRPGQILSSWQEVDESTSVTVKGNSWGEERKIIGRFGNLQVRSYKITIVSNDKIVFGKTYIKDDAVDLEWTRVQ